MSEPTKYCATALANPWSWDSNKNHWVAQGMNYNIKKKSLSDTTKDFTSVKSCISIHLPFIAKYTYTTGDCIEYGDYMKKDSYIAFDDFFYSVAKHCLLDPKCRAFKYLLEIGACVLCNTYTPRPSDSIWEDYQEVSIIFLLDSGKESQCNL